MDWIELLKLLSEVEEMKNKEKYAKEIVEIACSGRSIAFDEKIGRVTVCKKTSCCDCLFCEDCS